MPGEEAGLSCVFVKKEHQKWHFLCNCDHLAGKINGRGKNLNKNELWINNGIYKYYCI
jgi:hypothetical protein